MPGLGLDPIEFGWRGNGMSEGEILRRRRTLRNLEVADLVAVAVGWTADDVTDVEGRHSVDPHLVNTYMAVLHRAVEARDR